MQMKYVMENLAIYAPQNVDDLGGGRTSTHWTDHRNAFLAAAQWLTGADCKTIKSLTYDNVVVSEVDYAITLDVNGKLLQLENHSPDQPSPAWPRKAGDVGRLILHFQGWAFLPYLDQTLRRAPELDVHVAGTEEPGQVPNVIGWRCAGKPNGFLAPVDFLPGESGDFIPDKTVPVALRVPREFVDICDSVGMKPADLLRGFVGDLAGIYHRIACPRVDGYTSNGSDERDKADDWFERAYGHLREEVEERREREEQFREMAEHEEDQADLRNEAIGELLYQFTEAGRGDQDAFLAIIRNALKAGEQP